MNRRVLLGLAGAGLFVAALDAYVVVTLLPAMIGVPENKIRIVAPEVGGGFGSKLNLYAEEALVSHLAMRLGAPVKWIESRRENASATIHGRDQIGDYEVAVKKDGTLLGIKSRTIWIGDQHAKGYTEADILETCRRYISRADLDALKADWAAEKPPEQKTDTPNSTSLST